MNQPLRLPSHKIKPKMRSRATTGTATATARAVIETPLELSLDGPDVDVALLVAVEDESVVPDAGSGRLVGTAARLQLQSWVIWKRTHTRAVGRLHDTSVGRADCR